VKRPLLIFAHRLISTNSNDTTEAICTPMIGSPFRWRCIVEATMRTAVGVSLVICASTASSLAQEQGPAALPVGTMQAERKQIAKTKNFVGRVQAINKSKFTLGLPVTWKTCCSKRASLSRRASVFTKSKRGLFQAAVGRAAGELGGDKAKKRLTTIQHQRAEELAKTSAGTTVEREHHAG
jgi:membrane fusion protein, multidrug efflux system